jgi:hypothetical protein
MKLTHSLIKIIACLLLLLFTYCHGYSLKDNNHDDVFNDLIAELPDDDVAYFEASIFPRSSAYSDLSTQDVRDKLNNRNRHARHHKDDDDQPNIEDIMYQGGGEASIVANDALSDALDDKYKNNLLWIANDPKSKKKSNWSDLHKADSKVEQGESYNAYAGHAPSQEDTDDIQIDEHTKSDTNKSKERSWQFSTMNSKRKSSQHSLRQRILDKLDSLRR